ncbi:SDR family NAD(P)-dependent oxidoreductase (plasmid) [Skermanella mucosa]|uniref:SDR family NAD(P)-dependent oxidoreductase n=1 Tax=Skermanella mucosa TaxID=1789672 RepID=UPI00192AC9F0|nr:SDR family NAD(P)-dependent oxidoreductase [Skermanella mucosa]UEM25289.1 SDR family NAD(P)-dependent oxidoreductase [Skermanella mucosa]
MSVQQLAVVTGGSSGIGLELARQFARHGYDLVIGGQDAAKLEGAAALLRRETGREVLAVAADLSDADGVERFHRSVRDLGRPVDVFCANAGVGVGGGDFSRTDLDAELRLIDLNVRSQVHLSKLIVRDMVARGSGRILFTGSISGLMPGPFETVYSASKMFIRSFAEALRNELAPKGITVTALMPGPTDTDFFDRAGMKGTPVGDGPKDDPAEVARQGFEALMADRHHVISAGIKTKLQGAATNLMSDPMLAGVHRRMSEPRSARSNQGNGSLAMVGTGLALAALVAAAAIGRSEFRNHGRDRRYRS